MPPLLAARKGPARALFLGRDDRFVGDEAEAVTRAARSVGFEPPNRVDLCRQIHSNRVVIAQPNERPRADALVTREVGVAVGVVTADCVPMLLGAHDAVAAVHAGWKGLAHRIAERALRHEGGAASGFETGWIGPCMAACCYEVGYEVAIPVAAASGAGVVHHPQGRPRPFLALAHAARRQLTDLGLDDVRLAQVCTGCSSDWWSYRRLGQRAGRNLAVIWRVV